MYERVYESEKDCGVYTLPNLYGHVEDTKMFFVNEKIYMVVLSTGAVTFEDENNQKLAQVEVVPNTKNNMHDNVYCKVEGGKIKVWFPVVSFIDNYPYCDGEYDRWDVEYVSYVLIEFDINSHTVEKSDVKNRE